MQRNALLNGVGTPCNDQGEDVPLHGSIANTPCDQAYFTEEIENVDAAGGLGQTTYLVVRAVTRDETIFGRKLKLSREIKVSTEENSFTITDTIENTGDKEEPFEILYHMNMGYPLLDEDSVITIPSIDVKPRDEHAAEDLANWMHIIQSRGCP